VSNHVARDDEVDICLNMPIVIYDLEESFEMFQYNIFVFQFFTRLVNLREDRQLTKLGRLVIGESLS